MTSQLLAFLAVSVVVICTPGPDTALTVRNTLVGGRSGGVWTAAGIATGQAVWTVAAGLGVAGLLRASQPAFLALKLAGAGYLIYLGVQSLRAAWSRRRAAGAPERATTGRRPARAFRQGLLNDLGNPKMAAFFLSLLPQFVPGWRAGGALPGFLLLGLAFCALTFLWLSGYAVAVSTARRLLDRPRVRRAIEAVTGVVLVGLGLRLALDRSAA